MGRYNDTIQRITGKLSAQLRGFILDSFSSTTELQTFVKDNLGRDASSGINWSQAITYACSDLISYCQSRGKVGTLAELLLARLDDKTELQTFISYLVEAGYLKDNEGAAPAPSTNPRGRNWISEYGFDRVQFAPQELPAIAAAIAECFPTNGALEKFVGENIHNEYARQLQHAIDRTAQVSANVIRLVNDLYRIAWLNAFIMAVQSANNTNMTLNFLVVRILSAYAPAPQPAPQPAPKPAAPPAPQPAPPAAASTRAPQPAPKPAPPPEPKKEPMKVTSFAGQFSVEQRQELVALMLRAFQRFDLECIVHYKLEVQLNHIVADGPFKKVCEDVLTWCLGEEDKVVPLLNAILSERPNRTDVKPLLRKFAEAGTITIVGE